MHPKNISIKDYTYDLPDDRIAFHPLPERDASKLLIYKQGTISTDIFSHILTHLPENSLLFFNNSKVIEARILFQKPSGGIIEIFCLEPHEGYADIITAMAQRGHVLWKCLVGGASKWKPGQVLEKKIDSDIGLITLEARYLEKRPDHFIIELKWSPADESFANLLHYWGDTPLPPYIKRVPENSDIERYQTVYALTDGSVAAPTAGLHFTGKILQELREKNIDTAFVTLHVGAGTFMPVKADIMENHMMHAEFIDVTISTLENLIPQTGRNVIAVGTTSLRTIESLYWLGVKTILDRDPMEGLSQWDPYDLPAENISTHDALRSLTAWMKQKNLSRLITKTGILIAPGYQARCADALITNFHQPGSTLLLLVAALVGEDWKKIYSHALAGDFRFLSYGDSNLLWIRKD
jgi:S-adenosylmethionine:tRNA ribosyltransferase-isomerase